MTRPAPLLTQPDIELRTWQQFLAVAEGLHFGRAAMRLRMTQPPLTQAIQKLEAKLGVVLFTRTRRSVTLTPVGAALVEPVRQLLQAAAVLPSMAEAAASGRVGTLRLGFVSTVGFGPLPRWLREFREANADVVVRLREATWDVQIAAFARGELDAGFVLHAPGMMPEGPPELRHCSVGTEPLILALPESGPFSRDRLAVAELLSQPLVIFPRETAPSLYDGVLAFFHRHGATPVIAQEAVQMQTIVNLVSAGLGVALVPRIIERLSRSGVIYRALPGRLGDEAPRCETSLVWLPDASPAVLRFVDHVRRSLPGGATRRHAADD